MVRLGQRLLHLATSYLNELNDRSSRYPATVAALKQLKEAATSEFGAAQTAPRKKRRRGPEEQADRHRLTKKLRWQKQVRDKFESEVKALKASAVGGVLRKEWIARVFLSASPVNPRSLEAGWRDLSDATGAEATISHTYIRRIRDAEVEVIKGMRRAQIGQLVRRAAQAPQARSPCALAVVHLHDEASLRLRSSLGPRSSMPSRSRSSKVQQHVVRVHSLREPPMDCWTELEALADKTAATLATSIYGVLKKTASACGQSLGDSGDSAAGERIWLVHTLVGDGIATNEAIRGHSLTIPFRSSSTSLH